MKIVNGLEKTLGQERTQALVKNRVYDFTVDALAMNLFSLSYAINERFIAGMSWNSTLKTRLSAAVGNTLTGTPYRIWREVVMDKVGITKDSHWLKKYGADVLTFATGQTPLYVLYCLFGGADYGEIKDGITSLDPELIKQGILAGWDPIKIKKAATFLTLVAPALGRPQGLTYDFLRNQFGLEKKQENQK